MIARKQNRASIQFGGACTNCRQIVLCFAASLTVLPFALTPSLCQQQNASAKSRLLLHQASANSSMKAIYTGQVRFNKRSDAEASVQLLETIINRIMNIPQVAQAVQLNKSTGSQILAQNMKQSQSSPTSQGIDYKLAIRPKETGKPFAAPAPALQMIAQAPAAADFTSNSAAGSNFAFRQSARNSLPASNQLASALRDSGIKEDIALDEAASMAENWKGSTLTRLPIALKNEAIASADKPGFWDREAGGASREARDTSRSYSAQEEPARRSQAYGAYAQRASDQRYGGGLPAASMGKLVHQAGDYQYSADAYNKTRGVQLPSFDEAKKRNPDLANSINRFYKVTKKLEELQNAPEKMQQQQPPQSIERNSAGESVHYAPAQNFSAKQAQIVDDRPTVRDVREAPSVQFGANNADYAATGASSSSSSSSDPFASTVTPTKRFREAVKAKERSEKSAGGKAPSVQGKLANRMDKDRLALLPPNVATGTTLPLVSLGNSEAQVIQFLERTGKLKEQKIRNWSVYSWSKKDSDGSIALQLFFRHGLLDAIRIYDSTLIASDFGVSPGDQLETVKERFGEPAFLLPEPGNTTGGKNYIYPISQVGFQLARQGGESPQVVSVLIFSVK